MEYIHTLCNITTGTKPGLPSAEIRHFDRQIVRTGGEEGWEKVEQDRHLWSNRMKRRRTSSRKSVLVLRGLSHVTRWSARSSWTEMALFEVFPGCLRPWARTASGRRPHSPSRIRVLMGTRLLVFVHHSIYPQKDLSYVSISFLQSKVCVCVCPCRWSTRNELMLPPPRSAGTLVPRVQRQVE